MPGSGGTLALDAVAPAAREDARFSAALALRNGRSQWLGTSDGRTADAEGLAVRLLGAPATTEGRGIVRMRTDASGAAARYVGVLAPGNTSAAQVWAFDVPDGVEAFTVQIALAGVATIPAVYATNDAPAAQGLSGTNETVAAAVRTATGLRLPPSVYTWQSSNTDVATVSASGDVSRVGIGSATITLSANGVPAAQYPVQVCTNLAVGEVLHFTTDQAPSFCVPGGTSGAAEYTLLPSNLQQSTAVSLTVTGTGIQAVTGPPTPSAVRGDDGTDGLNVPTFTEDDERSEALAFAASPLPDGIAPQRIQAPARQAAVPNIGDSLDIQVARGCTGTPEMRRGGVRVITDDFILVLDGKNPPGGFVQGGSTGNLDSLANRLTILTPTLKAHFGTPTDLDNNGRIIVFYTSYVNSLSPPASSVVYDGLFEPRDLYSSAPGSCPLSNEGEYFYMLVPDPTGSINSNVRTVSSVEGSTTRTTGGLLARLIAQSKRIYTTNDYQTEESWIEQGLASMVEELMFYRMSWGLAPRQNIALSNLTTGPYASRRVAAFNTYANLNYSRLRPFLQRPDTTGAFKTGTSLASRGAMWAFLRYAIDRRVTEAGVTDASILQALAGGQPYIGKENLRYALGLASTDELDQWYRDFLVATYTDDAVSGIAARYTQPSWNFRSVYSGLSYSPPTVRTLTSGAGLTLSYSRAGSTAFMRFGVAQGGFASFTALSGGVPTPDMRFSIVRTK